MSRMLIIKWRDSGGLDGVVWSFKNETDDLPYHEIDTVGFLVRRDKHFLTIAQSENPDQWGRLYWIPTASIISESALREEGEK